MEDRHQPVSGELQIGDCRVRFDLGRIEREDCTTRVKPKAMCVLRCLAGCPGDVVTRDALFDAVWPGADVTDDTLTQCIVELRRAFGDDSRNPRFIETIPRRGFRLIASVIENPAAPPSENAPARWRPAMPQLRAELLGTALLVLVLGIILGVGRYPGGASAKVGAQANLEPKSIAVLPFADLSPQGDQGYLADGLAEEVLDRLAYFDDLRVTARTSSFQFRADGDPVAHIGEQLGVEHILRGSIRKADNRLRISTQLIDAHSGFNLWTRTYNRELDDIFALQAEIADSVAVALGVTLSLDDFSYEAGGTSDIEAFEHAMHGKSLVGDFSAPSIDQAIVHFRKAVEIDPDFAAAWIMLSQLYSVWGPMVLGHAEAAQWQDKARFARERAMALAPGAAYVLSKVAYQDIMAGRFVEAQRSIDAMVAHGHRRPTHAEIDLLTKTGRLHEAQVLTQIEARLDPMGRGPRHYLAHLLHMDGKLGEAIETLESEYELGEFLSANTAEGLIVALTRGDEALINTWLARAIEHQRPGDRDNHHTLARLRSDPAAVRHWLRSAFADRSLEDYWVIVLAGLHGENDLALAAMRRSRDAWAFWIPATADVRRQPEFKQLVRDIGLVDYWRQYGWGDFCRPIGEDDFNCA